ncbi:unnamed protein product, partial [Rotaria sp. Silwood1]
EQSYQTQQQALPTIQINNLEQAMQWHLSPPTQPGFQPPPTQPYYQPASSMI